MITPKNKIIFSLAGLGFLIIHFTATILYVAPQSWTGDRLKIYSTYYMLPLFHQQWGLFAPSPPTMDKKVKLTIKSPSKTYSDIELFDDQIWWHERVRIGVSGRFILLKGNVMYVVYSGYYFGFEKTGYKEAAIKELRQSKEGNTFKNLIHYWLVNRFPELREEKYFEVDSEIIFENYKSISNANEVARDTIHLKYKFKNEDGK